MNGWLELKRRTAMAPAAAPTAALQRVDRSVCGGRVLSGSLLIAKSCVSYGKPRATIRDGGGSSAARISALATREAA